MDGGRQAKGGATSDSEVQLNLVNDSERARKRKEVEDACDTRDVVELARLSTTPGGFVDDELRSRACTNWLSLRYHPSPLMKTNLWSNA